MWNIDGIIKDEWVDFSRAGLYKTLDKYCRPVALDEIRSNDYNLNIARYIDITEEEKPIDVQKVINGLKKLKEERLKTETTMNKFLKELGYRI